MYAVIGLIHLIFTTLVLGMPLLGPASRSDTLHQMRQDPQPAAGTTINTGAIIGIVVGAVLVLLFVGLLFWCGMQQRYPGVTRKRRRGHSGRQESGASEPPGGQLRNPFSPRSPHSIKYLEKHIPISKTHLILHDDYPHSFQGPPRRSRTGAGLSDFALFPSASRSNSTYDVTSRIGIAIINPVYFHAAALYARLEVSTGRGLWDPSIGGCGGRLIVVVVVGGDGMFIGAAVGNCHCLFMATADGLEDFRRDREPMVGLGKGQKGER
ncbi:hypothetical protein F4775DRAFT_595121 [Biscogniauxia sp. FL1348]|nr:hypothetical protein F4775DRAFT_595121 [Biscogniauxia sp. FL1348]